MSQIELQKAMSAAWEKDRATVMQRERLDDAFELGFIAAWRAAKASERPAFLKDWEGSGHTKVHLTSDITRQPDEFTLLDVLADIRQKTGVGDKPMLSDLADTLAERYTALDQTLDSMRQTNAALLKRLSEREAITPDELRNFKECKRMLEIACNSCLTVEEIQGIFEQVLEERAAQEEQGRRGRLDKDDI